MTQVYFRGAGTSHESSPETAGASCALCDTGLPGVAVVALPRILSPLAPGVEGDATAPAALPKSNAVPGVLGVFVAEPNDAKAPDPSPKAVEAPVVGEAMVPVDKGGMALKGLERPPWEEPPPPKRARGGWSLLGSVWSLFMDRESLEVLSRR